MTDEEIEALAIRAAKGNNGGEWATHYTDAQKDYWRQWVRDMMSEERARIATFVEGLRRDDDSASFYAEFDEARDIIAAKIRAIAV